VPTDTRANRVAEINARCLILPCDYHHRFASVHNTRLLHTDSTANRQTADNYFGITYQHDNATIASNYMYSSQLKLCNTHRAEVYYVSKFFCALCIDVYGRMY